MPTTKHGPREVAGTPGHYLDPPGVPVRDYPVTGRAGTARAHPARDAVAATVRRRIEDGTYPRGSRLPPLRALGAEHGCSVTPAAQARDLLACEGLLIAEKFRPCEVAPEGYTPAGGDRFTEALRWAWDGLYQISVTADGLEAWRLDGTGSMLAAGPEELRDAIREDFPKYAAGMPL